MPTNLDRIVIPDPNATMAGIFEKRNAAAIRRDNKILARIRGVQPLCRTCRRSCKVLRGSPGLEENFQCFDRRKR